MSQIFHKQGLVSPTKKITTIADGIAIKKPSQLMHDLFISKYVDDIVTVTDDEISEAMVYLIERVKTVTEGSGAAAFAGLIQNKLDLGEKTCVVLSGGNIDLNIVSKVIERGQIQRGRLVKMSVIVDDTPGSLQKLTQIIANERANILEVHHDRVSQGLFLKETRIDFVLETLSFDHIQKIEKEMDHLGYKVLKTK